MFGSPKDRLDFCRKEIHFETALLSDRTNAYLAAQSFLVIVYASSMANLNLVWGEFFTLVVPVLMAILGMVTSLRAWPGIKATYQIIDHWYFKQRNLVESNQVLTQAYDDTPSVRRTRVQPDALPKIPAVFITKPLDFQHALGVA